MLTTFLHTIWVNAANSAGIKANSSRFPTSITPSDGTFSIWSFIYDGLLRFVLSPAPRSAMVIALFDESCQSNRQWVHAFVQQDLAACQKTLRALKRTLRLLRSELTCADERYLFDVYRAWVSCASAIQDEITRLYSDGGGRTRNRRYDKGFSKLCAQLHRPTHNRAKRGVYGWLLQGLASKLTAAQIRALPRAYRRTLHDVLNHNVGQLPLSHYLAPHASKTKRDVAHWAHLDCCSD